MPQLWRIYLYKRHREGASVDQLKRELGLPVEEITERLEAAKLCFEKQVPFALSPIYGEAR